ncbi:LORF2 protein, partial [Crocuta crocuta]
ECKMVQPLWKRVWRFLKSKHIGAPGCLSQLSIYPREVKTYVHTETCTRMFTAALFIIDKKWKQPRYSSSDEQISNICQSLRMEYYSAAK